MNVCIFPLLTVSDHYVTSLNEGWLDTEWSLPG